ncbi:MAG: glycine cleavage system protein GcvH [Lentisphaerae bacterium]|nr:glycine cleavage system protein GcvH [Lentisphaerota bacterium]
MMKHYSEEHQWVQVDGDTVMVGVSSFAAEELGEVNFVELPELGAMIAAGGALCVVESVKAASDVIAPVSGRVVEVNASLAENPGLLNDSPEKDGWICKLSQVPAAELAALMDEKSYQRFLHGDKP